MIKRDSAAFPEVGDMYNSANSKTGISMQWQGGGAHRDGRRIPADLQSGAAAGVVVCAADLPDEDFSHQDGELLTERRTRLVTPPLYRVIMLNDDYTPMLFVVHILRKFFELDEQLATKIMLAVHTQGKGVCGVYTRDVAETKVAEVNRYARENEHPLLCEVEAVETEEENGGEHES